MVVILFVIAVVYITAAIYIIKFISWATRKKEVPKNVTLYKVPVTRRQARTTGPDKQVSLW